VTVEPTPDYAISPEDIERATFSTSKHGYDTDEVEVFLQTVAADMRALLKYRSDRPYEGFGQEMGALMQHAHEAAAQVRKSADAEALGILRDARAAAARAREEAAQITRRAESEASFLREESALAADHIKAEAEKARRLAEAESAITQQELYRAAKRVKSEARMKASEILAAAEAEAKQRTLDSERRLRRLQEAEMLMRRRIEALSAKLEALQREVVAEDAASDEPPPTDEHTNIRIREDHRIQVDEPHDETVVP